MNWNDPDLLRAFDLYLWAVLALGFALRAQHHVRTARVVYNVANDCKRFVGLINEHRSVLFVRAILLPLLLTIAIMAADTLVGQLVWPQAVVPASTIRNDPQLLSGLAPLLALMLLVDLQGLALFSRVDPESIQAQAQRAERWLRANDVTWGLLGIKGRVAKQVRKGLEAFVGNARVTLWHTAVQSAIRLAVGTSLWLWWALGPQVAS